MKKKISWLVSIGIIALFNQANAAPTPNLRNFSLIDADNGEVVEGYQSIKDGSEIDVAQLPTSNLSIRANTQGKVMSVQFDLDGTYQYTTNSRPYYLCGTTATKEVTPCSNLSTGAHTLNAVAATEKNGGGKRSKPLTVSFTIVGGNPNPEPSPEPSLTPGPTPSSSPSPVPTRAAW